MTQAIEITKDVALKVLEVVDAGLVGGLGIQKPGSMCVEAAVCYALGLPHGDDPKCVSRALRSLKIRLNDSGWSSDKARAKGLRRLAVAQLGSRDVLDDREFAKRVSTLAIRKAVPIALRAAASIHHDSNHKAKLLAAADRCEKEPTLENARSARDVARSASASASAYANANAKRAKIRDRILGEFAEDVVQILIEMEAPGCAWLALTEEPIAA